MVTPSKHINVPLFYDPRETVTDILVEIYADKCHITQRKLLDIDVIAKLFKICPPSLDGRGLGGG